MPRPFRRFWPLLFAVTIGLAARLWVLGTHSLLLDEAFVAVGARDMLQNHTPMWDAISNAPFVWMIAHLLGMGGLADPFLLRLPAALIGTASIIFIYWIARRMFADDRSSSERIAIVAAFLFAIHPFAVAFSRVLFADTFQVFFILLGCVMFDRFASKQASSAMRWREIQNRVAWLMLILLIWAAAFVMKYNAVVPGALWLVAGTVSRRYRTGPAFACFLAMTFGAVATLLLWPYDAPIWLSAFLAKGGSYNLNGAAHFFEAKIHLIFFGITEIALIAACVMVLTLRGRQRASIAHILVFILLYLITIVFLGRTFLRYLLVIVPFGCMLLAALFESLSQIKYIARFKWPQIAGLVAMAVAAVIFVIGVVNSYSSYAKYLHNDVDSAHLANDVLALEHQERHAFWLLPEPIGAYYLGLTQHYSRATYHGLDGVLAAQNYFEWAGLPYSDEWKDYSVLSVRRLARRSGVSGILASPGRFLDSARSLENANRARAKPASVNYLTSDLVRSGDLLIMQCGLTDTQGEPILEDLSHVEGPPFLPTLPLGRFAVYKAYRPDGISAVTDTTLDGMRAGAWVMIRK